MESKRKVAANVFMAQNAAVQQAYDYDQPTMLDDGLVGGFANVDSEMRMDESSTRDFKSDSYGSGFAGESAPKRPVPARSVVSQEGLKTSEELQSEKEPIKVRETGFLIWKQVVVPPNAYVVHTRMGKTKPVTIGLGQSFRMNPMTDAYLVVPAAMQTIGIVANSISKEKQGINILAYVQWQINDFSIAYRKLDFSDSRDPLGIVNAQLREQAEAAIKDKIATMSVEEVLTDKEPVIEELTNRLKTVAEGRSLAGQLSGDVEGLGIKIVTVQIKEAYVSSQRLWEHLQAPFRYEQEKRARISYLANRDEIRKKELEIRQSSETNEAETLVAIERIKQSKQTEALDIKLTEEGTRYIKEQETIRGKVQLEEQTTVARRESEQRLELQAAKVEQEQRLAELQREQEEALEQSRLDTESQARQKALQVEQALQELAQEARLAAATLQNQQEQLARETALKTQEAEYKLLLQRQQDALQAATQEAQLGRRQQDNQMRLAIEEANNRLKQEIAQKELEIARLQQEIRNSINDKALSSRLIETLPELASKMPEIHEYKVLQTGAGDGAFDSLTTFLAKMTSVGQSLGLPIVPKESNTEN